MAIFSAACSFSALSSSTKYLVYYVCVIVLYLYVVYTSMQHNQVLKHITVALAGLQSLSPTFDLTTCLISYIWGTHFSQLCIHESKINGGISGSSMQRSYGAFGANAPPLPSPPSFPTFNSYNTVASGATM